MRGMEFNTPAKLTANIVHSDDIDRTLPVTERINVLMNRVDALANIIGAKTQPSSSPVKDFKALAAEEMNALPSNIEKKINRVMAMIKTPHGAGRIYYKPGDGRLKILLADLNKAVQPLKQDPGRDLTPQEINAFVVPLPF